MAENDKELKDQRVVTMMSPSELEAIDDWMFKNRIRSRGEAIRRLCQIGIGFEDSAERLEHALDSHAGAVEAVVKLLARQREGLFKPKISDEVADNLLTLINTLSELQNASVMSTIPADAFRLAADIRSAFLEKLDTTAAVKDMIEEARARREG